MIYVHEPGAFEPPLGPLLGDMANELETYGHGSYISELISGGPKFCAYEVTKPNGETVYVCKIKGITLTHKPTSQLNFQSLRELVTGRSEHVTSKLYWYLLFDLKQSTPDNCRLRTNIFPEDKHHMVYLPTKNIKSWAQGEQVSIMRI